MYKGKLPIEWTRKDLHDMALKIKENPDDISLKNVFLNLIPDTGDYFNLQLFQVLKDCYYTHREETNFYQAAKEMDRTHTKTAHGYLSSGPNMFARAFNTYVDDKLGSEGKKYRFTEFENCNHIWYSGYYKTHPDADERTKFKGLFDKLIDDLKETGIISELTLPKKTNMKEVRAIVESRRERHSSSEPRVAQNNQIKEVRRRIQQ